MLALLRGASASFGDIPLDAEGDPGPVLPPLHREQHTLLRRPAQPARLEQRDLRPAVAASHRARPEIRHRRLRHPPGVRLVFQMERIELRVERGYRHLPVLVRFEQLRRPGPVAHRRERGRRSGPSAPLAPHRLELRIRRIACRQRPPRPGQHLPSPGPRMPREVRARHRRRRPEERRRPHCLSVTVPIFGKRLAYRTRLRYPLRLQELLDEGSILQRERRQRPGLPGQQPRIVEGAAEDEPRHRIDVRRHRLAPEPHRFQRDRPAARERVQHPRRPPSERLTDLRPEPRKLPTVLAPPMEDPAPGLLLHALAAGARRLHHLPRHPRQQLPSSRPVTRVRQQRRQQRRPARRQRPPRRPDVQRRDVPVPHVLLVHRVQRHLLQRKRRLDQSLVVQSYGPLFRGI